MGRGERGRWEGGGGRERERGGGKEREGNRRMGQRKEHKGM